MSATRSPVAGDTYLVMADLVTFQVTAADSGDRLTVVRLDVPPGGGPPPLHRHPPDEVFTPITGEITVFKGTPDGATKHVLGPGETVYVPGGHPHTFRNLTDEWASLLLTFTPGVMMERFFTEAGHLIEDRDRLPELDHAAEVERVFTVGNALGLELLDVPEA